MRLIVSASKGYRFEILAAWAAFMVLPSLHLYKMFGLVGITTYALCATALFIIGYPVVRSQLWPRLSDRQVKVLTVLTLGALSVGFILVYRFLNLRLESGGGDRDDAMVMACSALMRGTYPYYGTTFLHGGITTMPGAVLLAIPFFLLGNIGYQNIFWIAVILASMPRLFDGTRSQLLLLWVVLLFCPTVLKEMALAGDLIANALYVAVFSGILMKSLYERSSKLTTIFWCVLLGIGLSSRANFLLCAPLLFSAIYQESGLKAAVKYLGVALAVFALVTLPFYLYDPHGFSPIAYNLGRVRSLSAWIKCLVLAPTLALLGALCLKRVGNGLTTVFGNMALVQGVFLSTMILVQILTKSMGARLSINFTGHGQLFMWFGVIWCWATVERGLEAGEATKRGKEATSDGRAGVREGIP